MADQRGGGISWTDETWNPIRGCSRVSEGCRNCYAEGVATRFSGPGMAYEGLARRAGNGEPRWTGEVRVIPEHLADPIRWKRPRRIFVNSMSDLFHEKLTNEQIAAVFGVMAAAPQHTFQVLTKRAGRMREWFEWAVTHDEGNAWTNCHFEALRAEAEMNGDLDGVIHRRGEGLDGRPWPLPNVWLGVSAEDQETADDRVPYLLETPAAIRWVSAEPMIGPIHFDGLHLPGGGLFNALTGIGVRPSPMTGVPIEVNSPGLDWVVVGGESGRNARQFELEWATSIVNQCRREDVAVFVKQFGARPFGGDPAFGGTGLLTLRNGHGGDWDEWPDDLRVREYPVSR